MKRIRLESSFSALVMVLAVWKQRRESTRKRYLTWTQWSKTCREEHRSSSQEVALFSSSLKELWSKAYSVVTGFSLMKSTWQVTLFSISFQRLSKVIISFSMSGPTLSRPNGIQTSEFSCVWIHHIHPLAKSSYQQVFVSNWLSYMSQSLSKRQTYGQSLTETPLHRCSQRDKSAKSCSSTCKQDPWSSCRTSEETSVSETSAELWKWCNPQ